MKVFIWISTFFTVTLVNVLIGCVIGFRLGGVLLYVACTFLARFLCKKWDIRLVKKEAYSKGLSIKQYITYIVPASLITACEMNQGNRKELKKILKECVSSATINKRTSLILFEMYKNIENKKQEVLLKEDVADNAIETIEETPTGSHQNIEESKNNGEENNAMVKNEKPTSTEKMDQKKEGGFSSFVCSKKPIVILAIISSILLIVASFFTIFSFIYLNDMQVARAHYDHYTSYSSNSDKFFAGCGKFACQYCQGDKASSYTPYSYSPYEFQHYRDLATDQVIFAIIGVASLLLFIILIALLVLCLVYKHKKKVKPKINKWVEQPSLQKTIELKRKFCKYCGSQIDADSVFCSSCGKSINELRNQE